MKNLRFLALLALAVALQGEASAMTSIKSTPFGAVEFAEHSPSKVKKTVFFPADSREQMLNSAALAESAAKAHQENLARMLREGSIARCSARNSHFSEGFHFFPVFMGTLLSESDTVTYKGECFKSLEFSLKFHPSKENYDSLTVSVRARRAADWFCSCLLYTSDAADE